MQVITTNAAARGIFGSRRHGKLEDYYTDDAEQVIDAHVDKGRLILRHYVLVKRNWVPDGQFVCDCTSSYQVTFSNECLFVYFYADSRLYKLQASGLIRLHEIELGYLPSNQLTLEFDETLMLGSVDELYFYDSDLKIIQVRPYESGSWLFSLPQRLFRAFLTRQQPFKPRAYFGDLVFMLDGAHMDFVDYRTGKVTRVCEINNYFVRIYFDLKRLERAFIAIRGKDARRLNLFQPKHWEPLDEQLKNGRELYSGNRCWFERVDFDYAAIIDPFTLKIRRYYQVPLDERTINPYACSRATLPRSKFNGLFLDPRKSPLIAELQLITPSNYEIDFWETTRRPARLDDTMMTVFSNVGYLLDLSEEDFISLEIVLGCFDVSSDYARLEAVLKDCFVNQVYAYQLRDIGDKRVASSALMRLLRIESAEVLTLVSACYYFGMRGFEKNESKAITYAKRLGVSRVELFNTNGEKDTLVIPQ